MGLLFIGIIFLALGWIVPSFDMFRMLSGFEDMSSENQDILETSSFPKLFRSTFFTIGFLLIFLSFFEEDLKSIHILANLMIGAITLPTLALIIETIIILKFKTKK